jgi:hypothetical protein
MSQLYVGGEVDPTTMEPSGGPALLDADALTRHAVCVGMTGSGKTGLCTALLEELAMAGVPLLIIDPKGDMGNLALAFAGHKPEDFAPWVDPALAKREGVTVEQYAAKLSSQWKQGLADWAVGPDRVAAFTERAAVRVFTPGSTAGIAVDVLGALAPPGDLDEEGIAELIGATVGSLLALVGHEADPVTDPAHLVLARIVDGAWRAGQAVELEGLITGLVDPPFAKVGVFPVDSFFPRAERMKLAMQLNGLLASPAFAAWTQGVPLDPDALLAPVDGKTAVNVFSLAHLDDGQRMFFASQLLGRMVAWARRQPGTSALRALVYFDEVFGFLPPYPRNPPTKRPVLSLMKQARAVGVGTMLVTQNPVDVDYAALANAGLWLVGRLQTPQDRAKVVDGLASADGTVDKAVLDGWIAQLPARTFVVREAGSPAPRVIKSRQTISYLRGPLTRTEIERLKPKEKPTAVKAGPPPVPARTSTGTGTGAGAGSDDGLTSSPPPAPQGYAYRFLDPDVAFSARLSDAVGGRAQPARPDGRTVWEPAIYARLALSFVQGQEFVLHRDEHRLFYPIGAVREAVEPAFEHGDLLDRAPGPGLFAPLPTNVDEARELKALERRVQQDVQRSEVEAMMRHRALKLDSRAGESRADFERRVEAALDDVADAEIAKLKGKVELDVKRIADRRERLMRDMQRQQSNAQARQVTEVVNAGESIWGLFFGRRSVASSVSSAVSRRQQASAAQQRVGQTGDEIEQLARAMYDLEAEVEAKILEIRQRHRQRTSEIEETPVRLKANDVRLDELTVVWIPVTRPV